MSQPSSIISVAGIGDDEQAAPLSSIPAWAKRLEDRIGKVSDNLVALDAVVSGSWQGVKKFQRSGALFGLVVAMLVVVCVVFGAYYLHVSDKDASRVAATERAAELDRREAAAEARAAKRHAETMQAFTGLAARVTVLESRVGWILPQIEKPGHRAPPATTSPDSAPLFPAD